MRAALQPVVFACLMGVAASFSLHMNGRVLGSMQPKISPAARLSNRMVSAGCFAPTKTSAGPLRSSAQGMPETENRPVTKLRLIQHKKEAFWFYRFLSIVYDKIVNPGHWTEEMRKEALAPANLGPSNNAVVDVGGGTGFCTIGIVEEGVKPQNIVLLDQSPHQIEKAIVEMRNLQKLAKAHQIVQEKIAERL